MQTPILLILAGLVLLYLGGEFLVKGAGSLALRLGVTPLVAGLTVVAFGTSAPELISSVKAAWIGQGDLAIGNVIGANSINIGVILGLTAMICPLTASDRLARFDAPVMLAVVLMPIWFLWDRRLSQVEAAVLFGLFIVYMVAVVRKAKRTPEGPNGSSAGVSASTNMGLDAILILAGLTLLAFGSHWLIEGSAAVAKTYGVSEAIIGLTIVAGGSSTPELAACLVAAFRKQPEIALGNLVGSCIFNILAVLGLTGIIHPLYAPGVGMLDVAVMITFASALVPMIRSGGVLDRGEGICLLLGYGVYLYWLWPK